MLFLTHLSKIASVVLNMNHFKQDKFYILLPLLLLRLFMYDLKIFDSKHIESLIRSGNDEEAFKVISGYDESKLSEEDYVLYNLLKSRVLTNLGKYQEGLDLLDNLEDSKNLDTEYMLQLIMIKADILCYLRQYSSCLSLIEKGNELLTETSSESSETRAYLLFNEGKIYLEKGDYEQALSLFEQSLELFKESGSKRDVIRLNNVLGILMSRKGEIQQALEYYQKSLDYQEEVSNELDRARTLNNMGICYRALGDLDLAAEYYKRSLNHFLSIDHSLYVSALQNNLAVVYELKGDFDNALSYYRQALEVRKKLDDKKRISASYHNLGNVYHTKGSYKEAYEHYLQSYELALESGDIINKTHVLFDLIRLNVELEEKEQAMDYLEQLKALDSEESIKIVSHHKKLAEAIILTSSARSRDKMKAEQIFFDIIESPVTDHQLVVLSLLSISDILLQELKMSGEQEVFNELKEHINRLLIIAKEQQSYPLIAKTYLLLSQLNLLDLDINKARILLMQAQIIAEEKGMEKLAMRISKEHDLLLEQLSDWENLVKREASLQERTKLARLEDLLVQLVQRGKFEIPELKREESVLLLILTQEGLTAYSNFLTDNQADNLDEQLIGGFLSAINSFLQNTFQSDGLIERIKYHDYTIVLKPREKLHFCYVFMGQSYIALKKFDHFINTIHHDKVLFSKMNNLTESKKPLTKQDIELLDRLVETTFQ